jgi:hypothetical protein
VAVINNGEMQRRFLETIKGTVLEGTLKGASEVAQPVFDVSPNRFSFAFPAGSSVTGAITPYTAQVRRRLVITGVSFSFVKNATCDVATGPMSVVATIDGIATNILSHSVLTLTAERDTEVITFDVPILCDENTSVTSTNTFTVGAMRRDIIVYGYVLDSY